MVLTVRPFGFLTLLLAVLGQLLIGSLLPAVEADADTAALAAAVICHADDGPAGSSPAPPHRRMADCAVCPLCQTLAAPAAILAAPPAMPRLLAFAGLRPDAPPPARAPPVGPVVHAYARGPPSLLS